MRPALARVRGHDRALLIGRAVVSDHEIPQGDYVPRRGIRVGNHTGVVGETPSCDIATVEDGSGLANEYRSQLGLHFAVFGMDTGLQIEDGVGTM